MSVITLSDGSQEIRNPDGSLYMHFPPAAPSAADLEGWVVRWVSTAHTSPARCQWDGRRWEPVGRVRGGTCLINTDTESFNGLCRLLDDVEREYGYRAEFNQVATDTFRWTWERWEGGHHLSDMIIASKIH